MQIGSFRPGGLVRIHIFPFDPIAQGMKEDSRLKSIVPGNFLHATHHRMGLFPADHAQVADVRKQCTQVKQPLVFSRETAVKDFVCEDDVGDGTGYIIIPICV